MVYTVVDGPTRIACMGSHNHAVGAPVGRWGGFSVQLFALENFIERFERFSWVGTIVALFGRRTNIFKVTICHIFVGIEDIKPLLGTILSPPLPALVWHW